MEATEIKRPHEIDLERMSRRDREHFVRGCLFEKGERLRFNMSGYETTTGECTLHNQAILNRFAFLGIYDYTNFLDLDFYKGQPILSFRYWNNDEVYIDESDLGGSTTVELICLIIELTVLSGKPKRRRL